MLPICSVNFARYSCFGRIKIALCGQLSEEAVVLAVVLLTELDKCPPTTTAKNNQLIA